MANRTAKDASTVKGTNPQYLVEKIIRMRIYDSLFWKEQCFALSAELLVDKGMEIRFIGGVYGGNIKPTAFLCLTLKMLQIQPDKDIVIEFIRQEEFKYIRALGAFYMRLTGNSVEIYRYLEPLYNDGRKMRFMDRMGQFHIWQMDELMDHLLRDEIVFDVTLPRLQKRQFLEEVGELQLRSSALDEDLDNLSSSEDEVEVRKDRQREREPPSNSSHSKPRREEDRPTERRRRSTCRDRERRRERERDPLRNKGTGRREKDVDRDRKGKRRAGSEDNREIREANELRAKLGMAPLER